VFRAVTVPHRVCPDFARRPILRDLLEEIVMRVEKEAKARSEIVNSQAALQRPIHVFDAIAQRERELLNGSRARLANVVSADRNWVEARDFARAELNRVG